MIRLALLGAALALSVVPSIAGAQPIEPLVVDRHRPDYQSPQHFAFEIKIGPYSPSIDATAGLNGKTPFADLFNDQTDASRRGKRPGAQPLTTLELDWQLFHRFGSLGLAGSIGYMGRKTHSFQYEQPVDAHISCQVPDCTRSGDTTQLNVFPIALQLVYRFDVLALRYHVPFVPYVKAGLAYYFWFIQRGDGSLAYDVNDKGNKAIGGVAGWVFHPGVAFLLDVIDRAASRTMDAELGINHTYVFAEFSYADITGLGLFKDKLNLSDITWSAGLAFEF